MCWGPSDADRQRKSFSLEKKNQKTRVFQGRHSCILVETYASRNMQKFVSSFFQKRRIFLLPDHRSALAMAQPTKIPLRADYVIVGGGSAGAVLANRLSEDPATKVVLIEAGGEATSFMVQMPVGFAHMLTNPKFDWAYAQAPDASINGRRFIWSAGRMLGGSSSLNGQVYIRGARADFDRWAEFGAVGWSWNDVFPYFLRSEHWHGAPSQSHGMHGPLSVSPMVDPHPLCATFLAACNQYGLSTLAEYNDGHLDGAFLTEATQRDGWRCSTEKAYLRPARARTNLEVVTEAEADTILLRDGRAIGVAVTRGGRRDEIEAEREVIVCCGALGSPALLMRSGIGPGHYLRERGIGVTHNLPGVGQNLQEHSGSSQNKVVNRQTLNSQMKPWQIARDIGRFLWNRKGPMGAPAVQAMAFARTEPELAGPDIQIHFLPLAYDVEPQTLSAARAVMPKEPCVSINVTLCHPAARGRVELGADGRPVAVHQLLGAEADLRTHVAGMKLVDRIFNQPAFQQIITSERQPSPVPKTDAEWISYARAKLLLAYHPVGTCRMGTDEDAVVDSALRLRGVAGLRVVDASVMPTTTSGNTNAPTIMIAEKAADMIRSVRQ
jgi:choline dehydrogenase